MSEIKTKILNGKNEAARLLFSNADFTYSLIDGLGSLEDDIGKIPQSVIYFFQVLLDATRAGDEGRDLHTKLALLDDSRLRPLTLFPRYRRFAEDLSGLKPLLIPQLLDENASAEKPLPDAKIIEVFCRNFAEFITHASALVNSQNWRSYAEDILPKIDGENVAIRSRELRFTERAYDYREREIKPNDIYGLARGYDPELNFLGRELWRLTSGTGALHLN